MLDEHRLCLALSLLAGPPPIGARVERAAAAGYSALESWWPWDAQVASDAERDALVRALDRTGSAIHLLNTTEGHPRWGGRGVAGVAEAEDEFAANARSAVSVAEAAGIPLLHVLAGNVGASGREAGLTTLVERLSALAGECAPHGIGLVVEVLNSDDHPDYLLGTPQAARAVVGAVRDRAPGASIGILADTYHLARLGRDPAAFVREHADLVHHVQFADFPGRGAPGTGGIRFAEVLDALDDSGYRGMIGLEFIPGSVPLPGPRDVWRRLEAARADRH